MISVKKLLAWDTSSKMGSIAAVEWTADLEDVRLVTELTFSVDSSTHSERLLWGIHQALEAARWKLEDVDYMGVGIGPGSFTGLRIGVTTARTLAHSLQKPLVGVSSLMALARPVADALLLSKSSETAMVIAATDACKGELFALWGTARNLVSPRKGTSKKVPQVCEDVLSPEALIKKLNLNLKKGVPWIAIGEGRKRYGEFWEKLPAKSELTPSTPFLNHVQGRSVALLAWEQIKAGRSEFPALGVFPRYLRESDAEVKLKKGLLPKLEQYVP